MLSNTRLAISWNFPGLLILMMLSVLFAGCNPGSSSAPTADAALSSLTLSNVELDQIFQSSQTRYTASVNFLSPSTTVIPVTTNANATVTVNGQSVASGSASPAIALAEGENTITIVTTAADGSSTGAYTITVTRATAASFAQQAYLKASNAEADDLFGASVALSGDTLVVGAPWEDGNATGGEADNSASSAGAAYVFTRANGVWTQQAYLKAGDAKTGDFFGNSVAISGDTLVVGANGATREAAYVFTRANGNWTQQAYLKASNAEFLDGFGDSVAISGDTLVVGAMSESSSAVGGEADNSESMAGAVYVFTRANGNWTQQAYLKASNAEADDLFGASVAISGDTLVAGALGEDGNATGGEADNSAAVAGAAYVFTRTNGVWTQQAYIKASNVNFGDFFGASVAISGDTLVVGANGEASSATGGEADNSATAAGAAYVFTRTNGNWTQQAYLKASNAEANDWFGASVAISGDALVVSAYKEAGSLAGGEADNSATAAGAAYVFTRENGVWTQQRYLKASNAEANDEFGNSVAISGDTVVMGAKSEDSNANAGGADNSAAQAGAAYVWQ